MLQEAPITLIIIATTAFVSWRAFDNSALFEKLLNNPYTIKHQKQYYRLFSHALIHADWMHLILNVYVFYSFGMVMESVFKSLLGKCSGKCLLSGVVHRWCAGSCIAITAQTWRQLRI